MRFISKRYENIPDLIDDVVIDGKPYRALLKFKEGETKPRGYPDVYFDGQTWDFKETATENIDTIRQLIKDGRKADNVIFVGVNDGGMKAIEIAMQRELGRQREKGTWWELPNLVSPQPEGLVIELYPGWNWISNLLLTEHTVEEAFAGLTPADGDIIKSPNSYCTYKAGTGRWIGNLVNLTPGRALLYLNTTSETKMFSYPKENH